MDSQLQKLREINLSLTKENIRNSVTQDVLLMSAGTALESLQKVANNLSEKLREWSVLYNPELSRTVKDDSEFAEKIISSKRDKTTMGGSLSAADLSALQSFAKNLQLVFSEIKTLDCYIENTLKQLCPNTLAVAGKSLSVKLLIFAGGLKRLSEMPSSTIQVLGAEKALFRHIKQKSKSPKFGILFTHPLVQKSRKLQGKIARALADKISIAAKVDFFKGDFIGDQLKKQLETRFK